MIFVFFTYMLFASAFVSNKILVSAVSPALLVGVRMLAGGLLLQFYNYFFAGYRFDWKQLRKHVPLFTFIALATTVVPSILKAYGLKGMIASKAAFFGSLDPFITAIYAATFFDEKISLQKIAGITLGFLGTSVLLFAGGDMDEPLKAFWEFSWPELALLGSVCVSRIGWMIVQTLLKKDLYQPSQVNSVMMFFGGIIALVFSWLIGDTAITTIPQKWPFLEWLPFSALGNTSLVILFFAYTIIVGNLLAYTAYGYLLKRYTATLVSLAGFSVPLFVAMFASVLFGDTLSIAFAIACIITFSGMLLFFYDERTPA